MANEPVYDQHATAYLRRDDVKPAIRAFYSMLACAFSHSALEPVEHRWGWGQYFGPPSTDGAWFDLYRHMLIQEQEDETLVLLPATPRLNLSRNGSELSLPTNRGTRSWPPTERRQNNMTTIWIGILALAAGAQAAPSSSALVNEASRLAPELHSLGWLVFSAKTELGDWDLFLMRPDGTDRRPLTDTREFNEAGARFSPDGQRLLYYRMPKSEAVDNNTYGTFELIVADSDGRNPVAYGREFPWASWGPDGKQVVCLTMKGIQIVDLASRKVLRQLPRQGLVQQLIWSPDGQAFVGTANGLGPFWNIGRLSADGGKIQVMSETDRYNCTPDWLPDSQHVVYARGIIPQRGGRAELWMADPDGRKMRLLYAEEGRHIYGACPSPDGRYLLFTRSVDDLGQVDQAGTTMAIIRRRDTPMCGDAGETVRKRIPQAPLGPRLDLGPGWEPHWTSHQPPSAKPS